MRIQSAHRWLRSQFALIRSINLWSARTYQGMESVVPRERPALTQAVPALQSWLIAATLVFDVAWLAIWLLVALRDRAAFAVVLAALPVLKWLLLVVAQTPAGEGHSGAPAATAPPTQSRAFDPTSVTGGRTMAESTAPRRRRLDDQDLAKNAMGDLVRNS